MLRVALFALVVSFILVFSYLYYNEPTAGLHDGSVVQSGLGRPTCSVHGNSISVERGISGTDPTLVFNGVVVPQSSTSRDTDNKVLVRWSIPAIEGSAVFEQSGYASLNPLWGRTDNNAWFETISVSSSSTSSIRSVLSDNLLHHATGFGSIGSIVVIRLSKHCLFVKVDGKGYYGQPHLRTLYVVESPGTDGLVYIDTY